LAREHNNANVCDIGARQHSTEEVLRFIELFITTPYPGEERHARRIAQLLEFETTGGIAGFDID
jgi:ribose 5-phosphate isomerase B